MKTVYVFSRNVGFLGIVMDFMTGKVHEKISSGKIWKITRHIYHIAAPDILVIDSDPSDPGSLGGSDLVGFTQEVINDYPKIWILVFGPKEMAIHFQANPSALFVNRDHGLDSLLRHLETLIAMR